MELPLYCLDDLKNSPPERMPTGFKELDIAYGINKIGDKSGEIIRWDVGLPKKRVSLWAGSSGIGKSRMCMSIGCNMCCRYHNTVLYILNEDDPNNMAGWIKKRGRRPNFFVLGSHNRLEHKEAVKKINPDLVIIDSLTGLEGITSPVEIRKIMLDYKKIALDYDNHVILISHLNKEGSVKGNNDVMYYPDHICEIKPLDMKGIQKKIADALKDEGLFLFKVIKNRGGLINHILCFQHNDNGVALVESHIIGYNN